MIVGIDYMGFIVSYEELYVLLLQGVQNHKENRDRLVLGFDDGRQVLFLNNLQNESCCAKVRVHFGIEAPDGIIVVIVLTRNELGT